MRFLFGRSMRRAPLNSLRRWCSMKTSCALSIGQLWEIDMAKDSGGHGSEAHGGSNNVPGYTSRGAKLLQSVMRVSAARTGNLPIVNQDKAAAQVLASGPKSAPVATHPAMKVPESMDEFTHGHSSFER